MTSLALLFVIVAAWLVLAVVTLVVRHSQTLLALWREPMLASPVVIVESDDWGPGPDSDAVMLKRIASLLGEIRDTHGHPAVMTLGVVLGKPDGEAVLAERCSNYYRTTLDDNAYAPIVRAIRQGCATGVFALQRHGLEHCWPDALLSRAREDENVRGWLGNPDARTETLPPELQSRWVNAATLPSEPLPPDAIDAAIKEETDLFRRLFGAPPAVAVPNTFIWSSELERAWKASGVSWIVTCGRQYEGRNVSGGLAPAIRLIFNGEQGASGVRYVVRDAYFEPIRGHRAEHVWQEVGRRTLLGRPTLLETHRENFISAPAVADHAVAELERALRGVCQRYPDVLFMSTETLVTRMVEPRSPMLVQGAMTRVTIFFLRLVVTPALSRSLKLSGWHLLLQAIVRLLALVTSVPGADRRRC